MNLFYNTYHAFEYNGDYYLFDNERLISCIIEKHVYDALKSNDSSLLSEEELRMFETFHKQNLFFVDNPRIQYSFPKYDTVIISMALFHSCNLNCRYCFADAGENFKGKQREFTECSINATIDFLLSDPYFSSKNYYRINLVSGGEPLLNKKLFRTFIKIAFAKFEKAKKHLYIWFSTNGTLLAEEDLVFISKYNVGYGISIDGDRNDNDNLRVYRNGSGTYEDIIQNIRTIQNSPRISKRLKELWGLMVYSKDNIDLLKNIEHLRNLGFSSIQMRFVRSNDNELALSTKEATKQLCRFITTAFQNAAEGDLSLLRMICNESDYIGKIIRRLFLKAPVEVRCGAGSYMFSFAADGNIYPCDCFVGNPDYVMGSIYSTISAGQYNKYHDLSVYNRDKCRKCWAKNACGGDCYHNSYLKYKNLFTPDESYCDMIRPSIECIIASMNQFRMKNQVNYDAIFDFLRIREKMRWK